MANDDEGQTERRKGPTTLTLTFSGIISVAGLIAAGSATYSAIQSDLASLKRGEIYQERVNEQLKEDIRAVRTELKETRIEQRETMHEFSKKLDRLIEHLSSERKSR